MHSAIHHITERYRAAELHAGARVRAPHVVEPRETVAPRAVALRRALGWAMVHAGLRLVQGTSSRACEAHS